MTTIGLDLSSGDKRHIGRITKAGSARARYLLVEAAWRIVRSKQDDTAALRAWAVGIANRRGKRIAVVALARGSPESSTQCGVKTGRSMRHAFACHDRAPLH